jgi:hypothetical protein
VIRRIEQGISRDFETSRGPRRAPPWGSSIFEIALSNEITFCVARERVPSVIHQIPVSNPANRNSILESKYQCQKSCDEDRHSALISDVAGSDDQRPGGREYPLGRRAARFQKVGLRLGHRRLPIQGLTARASFRGLHPIRNQACWRWGCDSRTGADCSRRKSPLPSSPVPAGSGGPPTKAH